MKLNPLRKPSKLKIYAPWFSKTNWVWKYRVEQPLRALDETGLTDSILDRTHTEHIIPGFEDARQARMAAMTLADAYWLHMDITEEWATIAKKDVRPCIFYGVDDHSEAIEPFNPSYKYMGTQVNGQKLEPGDPVRVRLGPGGKDVVLYQDKEAVDSEGVIFDIEANHTKINRMKSYAVLADGIVVSSPVLARVWAEYGAGAIYTFPNALNFDIYPNIELREHPQEVRILWQGGSSHFPDLFDIVEPLRRVLNKYPHATLYIFGQEWPWLQTELKTEQYYYAGWVDPNAYTLRLSTLNHDINICPLRSSPFNEAKTPIKWYESSAICKPAVTLASRFGPFLEIEDGKTGLLYSTPEEFEVKLSGLIEDATLRQTLASNAKDWVHTYRDLRKEILPLGAWIQERCEVRRNANTSAASEPDEPGLD